jgi:hypothetical protein
VDQVLVGQEEDGRSWLGGREAEVDQVGEDDRQQEHEKHGVGDLPTYRWPGQGSRS